jgi:mannose-6-phosphate isomerase-like protein (cupin superfamily)
VTARSLERFPIHLGKGAAAEAQPEFPRDERAMDWYMDYGQRNAADGAEGRLVSMFSFAEDWPSWEMHPAGAEVVLCTSGTMTLHQEHPDGRTESVTLSPGEYAINPPGVWHTADIAGEATGVFITAGDGTQHRPR